MKKELELRKPNKPIEIMRTLKVWSKGSTKESWLLEVLEDAMMYNQEMYDSLHSLCGELIRGATKQQALYYKKRIITLEYNLAELKRETIKNGVRSPAL